MTRTLRLPAVVWRPPFRAPAPPLSVVDKIAVYELMARARRLGMERTCAHLELLLRDAPSSSA